MHNDTADRVTKFVLATMFGYVIIDAAIRNLQQRRARFESWRASFVAPFERTPGRVEWLRETLQREEHTIKDRATAAVAVDSDCGCTDA